MKTKIALFAAGLALAVGVGVWAQTGGGLPSRPIFQRLGLFNGNGKANQKRWDTFLDSSGNTDRLHWRLLDDSGGTPSDFLTVTRNGIDATACQHSGTTPPTTPCFVTVTTKGLNVQYGNDDQINTCTDNDDCYFKHGITGSANLAYTHVDFFANNVSNSLWHLEVVPTSYVGPAGIPPTCTTITAPYSCINTVKQMVFESDNVVWLQEGNSGGTLRSVTIGDTGIAGNITNLVAGSGSINNLQGYGEPLIMGLRAVKTAATARSSTTTLACDPDLTFNVITGEVYRIHTFTYFNGTTTGTQGIKIGLGGTAVASAASASHVNFAAAGSSNIGTGAVIGAPVLTSSTNPATISIANTTDWIEIDATVNVTTGGTVCMNWSQAASSANATNVVAGSYLLAERLN